MPLPSTYQHFASTDNSSILTSCRAMPLSPTCSVRLKIALDVFLLLAECTTALVFYRFVEPTTQGFRCDDISIRYPRQKDAVPNWALAVGVCLLPIMVILFSGILNHVTSSGKRDKPAIKACACALGRSFLLYNYGILICLIITGVLKTLIGSLRPHFIDSCKPDFSKINCSQGYIIDYTCLNQEDPYGVLDARQSFPSGHAALSLFMGTFLALHLEESVVACLSILLKSTLQLTLLLLCTLCAWSRLVDHRHHPADVIAGSLIGILVGLWVVRIFQHGFLQGWGPRARLVSTSVPGTKDKPTPSVGDPSTYI